MGEQSLKSLRGKRSTDVIFSGSDRAARLGLADVTLSLKSGSKEVWRQDLGSFDGSFLEASELAVTRRIHRDAQGEYLLNNKLVRLQDVLFLLAQLNLSSKTYSVVGQGTVDTILSITPAERKEFFEEASGERKQKWPQQPISSRGIALVKTFAPSPSIPPVLPEKASTPEITGKRPVQLNSAIGG